MPYTYTSHYKILMLLLVLVHLRASMHAFAIIVKHICEVPKCTLSIKILEAAAIVGKTFNPNILTRRMQKKTEEMQFESST